MCRPSQTHFLEGSVGGVSTVSFLRIQAVIYSAENPQNKELFKDQTSVLRARSRSKIKALKCLFFSFKKLEIPILKDFYFEEASESLFFSFKKDSYFKEALVINHSKSGRTNRRNTAKASADRNTKITLMLTAAGCNKVVCNGFITCASCLTIGWANL